MLHPFITEELVGQRRAALNAEASHERLAGQRSARYRGTNPCPPAPCDGRSRRLRTSHLPGLVDPAQRKWRTATGRTDLSVRAGSTTAG